MTDPIKSPSELADGAKSAFERGDFDLAIEGFTAARDSYQESSEHLLVAEMSNNLSVALLQAGMPEQALAEVEQTHQVFLAASDEFKAALAYGNLASALEAVGQREKAEEAMEQAIRLFKEVGDKEHLMHSVRALSELQLRRGRPLDAVSTMQNGLEQQPKLNVKNSILRRILSIPSRLMGR